jgi:hypothetical protein
MFVLKTLIDIYQNMNKKLYCVFIDFTKAFDTVWRCGLWQKMSANNIGGKCYRIIHNMYQNIKSCIMLNGDATCFFSCETGVRQGENLLPFLFSIYLNDLESFMLSKDCTGLEDIDIKCEEHLGLYLKLFVMLYADGTVLFSESPNEKWKLKVNISKTKVIIFVKRKI